jgi:hypothetical protein
MMDRLTDKLELNEWYKLFGIACALGLAASLASKNRDFSVLCFGGLMCSVGAIVYLA